MLRKVTASCCPPVSHILYPGRDRVWGKMCLLPWWHNCSLFFMWLCIVILSFYQNVYQSFRCGASMHSDWQWLRNWERSAPYKWIFQKQHYHFLGVNQVPLVCFYFLIEVKFIPIKIHHLNCFKVYSLVAFSIVTMLCNRPYYLFQNMFITPKRNDVPIKQSRPIPTHLPVSVDLPVLHISCKWKLHLVFYLLFFS